MEAFSLKSGMTQGKKLLPLLFIIVHKVLYGIMSNQRYKDWKGRNKTVIIYKLFVDDVISIENSKSKPSHY